MGGKQGRAASQGEACLQVEKMMGCGVEMPESEFFEPTKIEWRPGFLKKTFQFGRILAKEEGRMATLESYGKSRFNRQVVLFSKKNSRFNKHSFSSFPSFRTRVIVYSIILSELNLIRR